MASLARSHAPAARRLASPALRTLIVQRLSVLWALALAIVALTLLVALATYDPRDPSLDTATLGPATNLAGTLGASVADLLLQGFGAAGALPGLVLLAWAWRIGSGRGLGSTALRLAALLAALPVVAGVFASLPSPHPVAWPAGAGPGGAIGMLLSHGALRAGHHLAGPVGMAVVALLGIGLAVLLVPMALGLSRGEWRAAGRASAVSSRFLFSSGRDAASMVGRVGGRMGVRVALPGVGLITRAAGLFRRRAADPALAEEEYFPEPAMPALRREPRFGAEQAAAPHALAPEFSPPWEDAEAETTAAPAMQSAIASDLAAFEPIGPESRLPAPRAPRAVRPAVPPARKPRQEALPLPEAGWQFPPLSLLKLPPERAAAGPTEEALEANARLLETVLADYGVQGSIVEIRPGPVVTLYELEPAPGIRSARVIGLADDIARSMSVTAVRIATVQGRNVIGIEVPNARRDTVFLSELLSAEAMDKHPGRLALALGKDIGGAPIIADLARMPHLMIAGTTGSGKSVGVNAMILSLLYRTSPDQCRLILIDPKMLELSVYEGIPHLMAPVVTEPAKAVTALKWVVREMERRYRAMSQLMVRSISAYNERVADARARGEVVMRKVQTGFDPDTHMPTYEDQPLALETLPFIVVVVDEMADLMMVAGKEIEAAVQRLAQMARAAGIHVIMATQRPSVDVITGTIKANFPTRISFQVISKFDSRTILGEQGAEQLLGMGDMLYMAGGGRVTRVHGPFVSDREVEDVVAFLRAQGEPAYIEEVTEAAEDEAGNPGLSGIAGASDGEKGLFDQAVALVAREGKASTSFIQRHLNIGYNRAAKLIEQMEKEGIVGAANHVGKREVLVRRTRDED
ncbi:MAG: DNA translocase FtsK 4TM domain-containing protein [Rhodospirillales bacterium]|nr:DNA translocase FtsK 4TM domain-containing protein [Rhodospirillales bacterium]